MVDTDRMVRAYIKMRDAKIALTREYEAKKADLEAKMDKVEAALLGVLNTNKADSMATAHGTFYRQEKITPTAADWTAFYDFVKREDAFEALEKRITKRFVTEYMEMHDGTPPPGVSVFREYEVRIRRPNK